eukprot:SAG31_NODE_745_length_12408_cov_4.755057_3_plen_429_part_00
MSRWSCCRALCHRTTLQDCPTFRLNNNLRGEGLVIDGYSFGSRHDDETRCPSGTELSADSTIQWSAGVGWGPSQGASACTYGGWEICVDSGVDDGKDSCDSAPCLNGGLCVDGTSTYACTCASGWYGDNCGSDVRFVVERGPCTLQEGGRCVGRPQGYAESEACTILTTSSALLADCPIFDTRREQDSVQIGSRTFDECPAGTVLPARSRFSWHSHPQSVDGSVQPMPESAGWEICADDALDSCLSAPCENEGQCVDSAAGYACSCTQGWCGDNCALDDPDAGPCASMPCANEGQCTNINTASHSSTEPRYYTSYTCICAQGWHGDNCGFVLRADPSDSLFTNPGFEADPSESFQYTTPTAWQSTPGRVAVIPSGSVPWGGLQAADGDFYAAVEGNGTFLEQTVGGENPQIGKSVHCDPASASQNSPL